MIDDLQEENRTLKNKNVELEKQIELKNNELVLKDSEISKRDNQLNILKEQTIPKVEYINLQNQFESKINEMNDEISPREAGLGIFVKLDKACDFVGKGALIAAGEPARRKIGLKVTGRGIVREEQDVYKDGKKVGVTCSGTFLPFLKGAYATALVEDSAREMGSEFQVDVRGRMVECEQVKSQFYKRQ